MKINKNEISPFTNFYHRKLDISKTVTAREFKVGQMIEGNDLITW